MELEELKSAWAQYDKKLTKNLKLNEELLRKMNLGKSKKEMNTPLIYEFISFITGFIFLLYIIIATITHSNELKFLIPGIISCLMTIALIYLSGLKIKLLTEIDFYFSPVIELQRTMNTFKQKSLEYKKYEFYIFPVFAISTFPILEIALCHFDIYKHPTQFIIGVILSLILGYSLANWGYKNLFDKKVKNTIKFLDELSKFENEQI